MMRLWFAVWMARLSGFISRLSGRGGSSLPGVIARKVDPQVLSKLVTRLPQGTVLVTGTNGKTTTVALTAFLLRSHGYRLVHNRAGANLILGLTATVVQAEKWRLFPRADLALLETDEASMPRAAQETHPKAIAVTNFFRDQLDRYGELSTTVDMVQRAIQQMGDGGQLILNADDPQVAYLGEGYPHVVYFGLGLKGSGRLPGVQDTVDARFCPRCGEPLHYQTRYYAHLGDYYCSGCGWRRPNPDWTVAGWDKEQNTLSIDHKGQHMRLPVAMPGIYNVYNQVAAIALAAQLGVEPSTMGESLSHFEPAFGRMESVMMRGHPVRLALVKNPVGFTQVLEAVADDTSYPKWALVIINDRYADGTDVSWLWDVDFESLAPTLGLEQWWVSGIRAFDMAVRLKYAGIADERVHVVRDPGAALEQMINQSPPETSVWVMPTYTALLEVRQYLTQHHFTRHFREG